jgi:hypothetical protein
MTWRFWPKVDRIALSIQRVHRSSPHKQIRQQALRLLAEWRGLLGKHVATSRQQLRKLLDRERFVFYPMKKGATRWYEIGVTPSLEKFFAGLPGLRKAGTSPTGTGVSYEPVFQGEWLDDRYAA